MDRWESILALRDRLHAVVGLAAWTSTTNPVEVDGDATRRTGVAITTNLLPLLGVSPALGHWFATADGIYGNGNVVLVSDALWRRDFAGAGDIVGKRMSIDGAPFTIVGVMPAWFHYPSADVEYWQPYVLNTNNLGRLWGLGEKHLVGRLAPGATLTQARGEVKQVWPSLRRSNPLWDPGPTYRANATITPLQTDVVGSAGALLWMLFGATLLVLVIACVNVANLLLARAIKRERELSVRAALGGGRGRLVRQLLTESVVLAALGGVVGLMLGWLALRGLIGASSRIPRADEISMNAGALAFGLATTVVTGILFGIIPAFRATGTTGGPSGVASAGRRATASGAHLRLSGALVAGEVALAVILATASLLLVRSFDALRSIAPGFETTSVIAARVSMPGTRFKADTQSVIAFYDNLLDRTRALVGVRGAALVDHLPLAEPVWGIAMRVQGQFEDFTHTLPMISHMQIVTPAYFATMGIPVLRGRALDATDRGDAPPVAVVSQSTARRFWPRGDAIGQRLGYPYDSPWITIVGIVPDTKQDSLRDTSSASLYVPWRRIDDSPANCGWWRVRLVIRRRRRRPSRAGARPRPFGAGERHPHDERGGFRVGECVAIHDAVGRGIRCARADARRRRHLRSHVLLGR